MKILCENKDQLLIHDFFWFSVFQTILTEDVQEFHPYVFQVLSLLLEVSIVNFQFHEFILQFSISRIF